MKSSIETRGGNAAGGAPVELPDDAPTWRRIPLPGEAEPDARRGRDPQRRLDQRTALSLRVQRSSIDASRDPVTGAFFYDVADDDETTNLSRRGLCIRCERPPEIGSRVLVQLRFPDDAPIDVVGLARWTQGRVRAGRARRARGRARRSRAPRRRATRARTLRHARSDGSRAAPTPRTNPRNDDGCLLPGPPIA